MEGVVSQIPVAYADAPVAPVGVAPEVPAQNRASLYVGDLRSDVNEGVLYHHFKGIGQIMSVRVLFDKTTNVSLGYAYVNFFTPEDAERALNELQYSPINGKPCRISHVERNPEARRNNESNVFVRNVGREITPRQFHDHFAQCGEIISCKLSTDDDGKSFGYGFVHFKNVEDAKKAIEMFNEKKFPEDAEKALIVEPFKSREERPTVLPENTFTNVYIKNFPTTWTTEEFTEIVSKYGLATSVCLRFPENKTTPPNMGFGFCNYKTHEEAVHAVEELKKLVFNEKEVYAGRAMTRKERAPLMRPNSQYKPGTNLYIRGFPESFDDAKLKEYFASCGTVESSHIMLDRNTRKSRGFGFVVFSTAEEALRAISTLNGAMVEGKPLYVQHFQTREQRSRMMDTFFRNYATASNYNPGYPYAMPAMYPGMSMTYPQTFRRRPMNRGPKDPAMRRSNKPRTPAKAVAAEPIMPAQPEVAPVAQPVVEAAVPAAAPAAAPAPEELHNAVGEAIFMRVYELYNQDETRAGKIAGMILEGRSLNELAALLNAGPNAFDALIAEANDLYERMPQQ